MATGDMQARLLLDSKDFDKTIKKAKTSTKNFKKETVGDFDGANKSLGNMVGTLGKIAPMIGVATSASQLFNQTIASSQTLTDKWGRTVESAKTVWNNFLYSVSSGDWTAFRNGLGEMVDKSAQLYNIMDKLANVKMSAAFVNSDAQYKARQEMLTARNKQLPIGTRKEALQVSIDEAKRLEQAAQKNKETALQYIKTLIGSKGDINPELIQEDVITKAFELDLTEYGDEEREKIIEINSHYAKITQEAKEIFDQQWKSIRDKIRERVGNSAGVGPGVGDITIGETFGAIGETVRMFGQLGTFELYEPYATPEELRQYKRYKDDYEKTIQFYQTALAPYLAQYVLLERLTDEELGSTMQEYMDATSMLRSVTELRQSQQELSIQLNNEEAASIAKKAKETKKYAKMLEDMPWKSDFELNLSLLGLLTPENIANFAIKPSLRREMHLGVPGLPEYGGEFAPWNVIQSSIKSSGALEAMTRMPFDPNAARQMYVDSSLIEWAEKNREEFEKWSDSVGLLSNAFGQLGASIGGTTGQMLTFIGTILDATQQMLPLIAQIMAEKAARDANATSAATEAAAKTLSAHAGIPFAGVALGVAAVGAIIAAIQSVPKFADGGIVNRATLGIFGEAGPEAVMPLDKLEEYVTPREMRVTGNIKASGKDLVVVLDNYNRVRHG